LWLVALIGLFSAQLGIQASFQPGMLICGADCAATGIESLARRLFAAGALGFNACPILSPIIPAHRFGSRLKHSFAHLANLG